MAGSVVVVRSVRPPKVVLVLAAAVHLAVVVCVYAAQRRFYSQLGGPGSLGYGMVDIALQPATVAITLAVVAVAWALTLLARRWVRVSMVGKGATGTVVGPGANGRVVVLVVVAVLLLAGVAVSLSSFVNGRVAVAERGRTVFSVEGPFLLRAQVVRVTGVSGFDLPWRSGAAVFYLGDSAHESVFRVGEETFLVPVASIAVMSSAV